MKFKKFSKKAISLLLAILLICSCITISFSSFAVSSAFSVTKSSPAVPLYVGKAVRTGNLLVELGLGSKAGNTLSWKRISGTSAYYNDGGYLVGNSVGVSGFTVSDGYDSANVWVIVNAAGDTDFNLLDVDFSNGINTDEWVEGSYAFTGSNFPKNYSWQESGDKKLDEAALITGKFAKTTGIVSSKSVVTDKGNKKALYIPAASHGVANAVIYNNQMMKDFSDYSVEAEMSNVMAAEGTENMTAAPGLLLRTDANYNAAAGASILSIKKSLSLKFRNYGGVSIYGLSNADRVDNSEPWENIPLWRQAPYTFYTEGVKADYFMCEDKSKVFYPDQKDAATLTTKNVVVELSGIGIKYTLNGNKIFDTISDTTYKAYQMGLGEACADTMAKNLFEPVTASYINMYNQNIKAEGGTVGFTNNYGNDLYVYSIKVTPNNIAEQINSLPEMLTVKGDYTMAVNTGVALKNIGVTAADTKNDNYEIIDGNLLVYKVPTTNGGKITLGNVTIQVLPAGSSATISAYKFADDEMVITSNGDNSFTASVSGSEVVPGSLKVTEKTTKLVYGNDNANGKAFTFTVADPTAFVVTAQYTTKAENLKKAVILGASIRVPDAANKAEAIRFLTRVPAIKNSALYSDANATYKAVGTLIMPKALLGSNKLQFPSNSVDPTASNTVTIGGQQAKNVVFENLSQTTANYSDAWTTLYYGEQEKLDVLKEDMAAVSYVWYQTSGGTKGFYYGAEITKSYNGVYETAMPLNNNDTNLFEAVKNKNMYVSGSKSYFGAELAGAYSVSWEIKNGSGSVITSGRTNAPGTFAVSVNGTASDIYLEATLYNEISHSDVQYNNGEAAKFTISTDDIQESPDAPGGSAANPIIIDDNPILPVDPGEEDDPGEHTAWTLDNTYYKLTHDRKLKICYVGGSVTAGTGAPDNCWRTRTTAWFKSNYGGVISEIKCYSGGVSSVWNAPHYERDAIPQQPDLVFLECSVNDFLVGANKNNGGYPGKDESAILMDTMIRRTKQLLPNTDIIVLTVDNQNSIRNGNPNGEGHKAVAEYEKVPYLNVKESLLAVVGNDLSKWSKYITDDVHPNAEGYKVYADYITGEIAKMLAESAERKPVGLVPHTVAAKPYLATVPSRFEIIDASEVDASVYEGTGWEFSKMPVHTNYSDYMIKATRQGAKMSYTFTGATTFIMPGVYIKGCSLKVTLDGKQTKTLATTADAGQAFLFRDIDPNTTHTVTMEAMGDVANIRCEINCIVLGRK